MKRHASILIGLLTISLSAVAAKGASDVAALSYQASTGMKFTFNPTLNLTVSSGDLIISGLAPGNSADSNEITVTIGTNASHGYALYATAGNNSYAGSSNFAANDLVLTNGGSVDTTQTNKFTSLATDASVASMSSANPNTWGYAYATYNTSGSTWNSYSNYSGLPVYTAATGAELLSTNDAADNQSVKFKIGANADNTQASGDYTNVINFYAVANPEPDNTMQGFAAGLGSTTCSAMSTGDTLTLEDSRDGQSYTVAKLADGKCWMTENLNLAGGTALSADDTDVTSTYISSFSTSNNLTKANDTIVLPASNTTGFDTVNYSYVYNSGNKTNCGASGQNTPCFSYYSWDAATLGSGRSIASENTDAEQSICPKGWRLPTSGGTSDDGWKRGDFYAIATAYGANLESNYYESSATFYNNAGPGTTPNFLLAGSYFSGSFRYGGSNGYYWSSTSYSGADIARILSFNSSNVYSANSSDRRGGYSVRCLYGS